MSQLNYPLNNIIRYGSPSYTYPSAVAASFAMTWSTDPINIFFRIQNASLALKHQIHVPPVETDVAVRHQWWQSPVRVFDGSSHKHVPIKVAYIIWTIKKYVNCRWNRSIPVWRPRRPHVYTFGPVFVHFWSLWWSPPCYHYRIRMYSLCTRLPACTKRTVQVYLWNYYYVCALSRSVHIINSAYVRGDDDMGGGRARYGWGGGSELLLPHDDDGRMSGSFITVGVGL